MNCAMPDRDKAVKVLKKLKKEYPGAKYYLNFNSPLQLLVAAILSAQCRDEVVNEATKKLFKHFKKPKDFAGASVKGLLKHIDSVSFAGNKAKYIINACKKIVEEHGGKVPKDKKELETLPGIGSKTAIVIQTNAFDIVSGVVVDTHVIRVSYRLGWTGSKKPGQIEKDLNKLLPEKWWKQTQWLLKAHGRKVCTAPNPHCSKCPVEGLCPKKGVKKEP